MEMDRKEILLYPAIVSAGISGINAFGDWRRGTLDSFWWYVIAALCLYAVLTLSRYLIWRKKEKARKSRH